MARDSGSAGAVFRAGARGMVAAMAMSGVRSFTANLGLLDKPPPQKIVEHEAPPSLRAMSSERRAAVIELAHWAYGAGAGTVFGLLPRRVRAHPLSGPAYGVGIWLLFESVIAPALGVQSPEHRTVSRLMLVTDHVLYGTVVAGRFGPEPESRGRRPRL